MVQEILGPQPSLGAALGLLADLSMGRLEQPPAQASESLKLLVGLIRRSGLPASRRVLFDRLKREIKGTKPLTRNDLNAEREELARLEQKLRDGKGEPVGGAELSAAFASRREEIRKAHLRKAGVAT